MWHVARQYSGSRVGFEVLFGFRGSKTNVLLLDNYRASVNEPETLESSENYLTEAVGSLNFESLGVPNPESY